MAGPQFDVGKMVNDGVEKAGSTIFSGFLGSVMGMLGSVLEVMVPIALAALAAFGLDKWLNDGNFFKPILDKMGWGKEKPKGNQPAAGATADAPKVDDKGVARKGNEVVGITAQTQEKANEACKSISGQVSQSDGKNMCTFTPAGASAPKTVAVSITP